MEQFDQPALDDLAARVLDTGMAPAIAVALTDHERTTMTPTFGAASPDALWPIASIGKSFTAVIALQLVEEGLLDLHAPVTDYVPWLSVRSEHRHYSNVGYRAVGVILEAVTGRPVLS